MQEESKHLNAFEIYYNMGDKRTFVGLSKEEGITVTPGTLNQWAKNFNWAERIKERDEVIRNAIKRNNSEENEKTFRIYQATIRQIIKEKVIIPLSNGEDMPDLKLTAKDLVALIKADVDLAGGIKEAVDEGSKLREKEQKFVEDLQTNDSLWKDANSRIKIEN